MRRITVFEIDNAWTFAPGAHSRETWPNLLQAANAAVEFGNTLQGQAAGYVVRLVVAGGLGDTRDDVTMCTHVF